MDNLQITISKASGSWWSVLVSFDESGNSESKLKKLKLIRGSSAGARVHVWKRRTLRFSLADVSWMFWSDQLIDSRRWRLETSCPSCTSSHRKSGARWLLRPLTRRERITTKCEFEVYLLWRRLDHRQEMFTSSQIYDLDWSTIMFDFCKYIQKYKYWGPSFLIKVSYLWILIL